MTEARESRDAGEWLAEIDRDMADGEYLQAYDAAERALDEYPDDAGFRHKAVLALARTGAIGQAAERFERYGLNDVRDEETLALAARLAKDLALAAEGAARLDLLAQSADAYKRAYEVEGGYYPAINVATLLFLAHRRDDAAPWAERVLALTREDRNGGDYYALASRAEALLLLGRADEAAAAIAAAVAAGDSGVAVRSVTLKQLRLICGHMQADDALLVPLAPPAVVHFFGHIVAPPGAPGRFPADQAEAVRREIDRVFARRPVSRAIGSIAAGADILAAEAALDAGVELDLVLPFGLEEFIEISVAPAGADWVPRMRACLERARRIHHVTEDAYLGDDALFGYASEYALGLASLRARLLATDLYQLAVWDGVEGAPDAVAGTAHDLAIGRKLGCGQEIVSVTASPPNASMPAAPAATEAETPKFFRAPRSLLFGDFKGFSKLTDAQLPVYVEHVLGLCAAVLKDHSANLVFQNTWGDGLFLVFDDVAAAADCAFATQAAISAIDHAALGLPETLGLRLGFHYGPVFETMDPVLQRKNCFGYHVSRAARVEPITPEKAVYVTEQTAAAMALACPDAYRCEYVGRLPLAKGYGSFPMYHVRAA